MSESAARLVVAGDFFLQHQTCGHRNVFESLCHTICTLVGSVEHDTCQKI